MGRGNDHPTRCSMRRQQLAEPVDRSRVQPQRRFIQQPERRGGQQQPSNGKPAFLAGRQHFGRKVSQCRQPDGGQSIGNRTPGNGGGEVQVLGHCQTRLYRVLVAKVGDAAAMCRQIGQRVGAIPRHPTGGGADQPGQQPQKRRLPRSVRTGEHQRTADRQPEADVAEHQPFAPKHREILGHQHPSFPQTIPRRTTPMDDYRPVWLKPAVVNISSAACSPPHAASTEGVS